MIWKLQPNRVRRAYFGGEHIDAMHGDPPVRGRYPEEWIASCAAAFNPDCPKPNEGYSALPDGTLLRLRTESGWLRDAQEADGPLCWADQESSARETRMYLYGWLDALPESAELRFPYGDPFAIPIQWKEVSE